MKGNGFLKRKNMRNQKISRKQKNNQYSRSLAKVENQTSTDVPGKQEGDKITVDRKGKQSCFI